jgi:hypothetical protein
MVDAMLIPIRRSLIVLALLLVTPLAAPQGVSSFEVRFGEDAFESAYSGELFIAFAELGGRGEPRSSMHGWFGAPPVMRFDVRDVAAGTTVRLRAQDAVATFPPDWSQIEAKPWRVQAIARVSRIGRQAGLSAGDVFSGVGEITYHPAGSESVRLALESVVEPAMFPEDELVREFELVSPALSEFYGFEYTIRAGVLLPPNYGDQEKYPVLYSVTGFGGTHMGVSRWAGRVQGTPLENCILVVPDATNLYGHSVFCDSRSIGPWGEALVDELIPALEEEFGGAGAAHRYVTGVSSGGWSSLWLQVAYPEEFAGCWSHVPDPIDFHDFQQINLYEPLADGTPRNMYVDESGELRPVSRRGDTVTATYKDFVLREDVLNPGGQIRSFEATFSPPNEDGTPRRVFDVETGVIDHEAAQAWRPYDISHQLLTRWDELRPRLLGKIHVYAGSVDTFYLEGAVERFQELAAKAGMLDDMVVEVIPGMAHSQHQPGFQAMAATIAERWSQAGE